MKKSILILALFVGVITAQADDYPYLTFETNNGEKVSIEFSSDLSLVFDIYNLQGRKLRSCVSSFDGLPKGIYVIRSAEGNAHDKKGKKIVVR